MSEQTRFDYIVVGGGHAGCVVASRLSQYLPNSSIALVETGPNAHDSAMVQSSNQAAEMHGTSYHWNDVTVPQPGADDRQIYHGGGRLLSGSSAVNYGSWVRGHHVDFDEWAKFVDDDRWSYQALLPYFRKTETHHQKREDCANPEEHGFDGPIHTTTSPKYPLGSTILEAMMAAGHKELVDANSGHPLGVGRGVVNWRNKSGVYVRQPAGVAYDLSKVHVITDTLVHKVIIEKDEPSNDVRAVGIDIGNSKQLYASKEVIVSCGSLRTPQLLMLSGLGDPTHLESHSIQPLLSVPSIGQNLHDHCSAMLYWKLKHPEKGLAAGAPNFDTQGMAPMEYILTGTISSSQLAPAMEKDGISDPLLHGNLSQPRAHYETAFTYYPAGLDPATLPPGGAVILTGIANWLPTSRGRITLRSANPSDPPAIDPQYLTTHYDRAVLREAVRDAMRIMDTPAAKTEIEGLFHLPGPHIDLNSSDDEIDARVRQTCITWFHPGGTAAMGSVVDTECRVKGVHGLRVVDASIIPLPLAAHYQAPVYAIAEKAAEMIAGLA